MAALTAAAMVGTAAFGAYSQDRAAKKTNRALRDQEARAQALLAEGQKKAVAAQNVGIKQVAQGFDKAAGLAGTVGVASRARTLRREKASLGRADASAASRGMYNSTQALNQRRGVQAETDLTLSTIDESVAGLLSSIQQNKARAQLQAQQGLASIYSGFAPQQAGIAMQNTHAQANVAGGLADATGPLIQLLQDWETS